MKLVLDLVPGDDRALVRSYTLDGVAVRLWLQWHDVTGRWQLEVRTPAGRLLGLPSLAAPGGVVRLASGAQTPPGTLRWEGVDPYTRTDLGRSLRLVYDTAEEEEMDLPALVRAVQ